MPDKVKLARLCLLVAGWLKLAAAGLFLFILVAGSVLVRGNAELARLLGSALLGGTGVFLCAASAAAGTLVLLTAAAVRRHARWGRTLGIILGFLMLPLFPVGTVLGLFVLTGLLGADARAWFSTYPAGA